LISNELKLVIKKAKELNRFKFHKIRIKKDKFKMPLDINFFKKLSEKVKEDKPNKKGKIILLNGTSSSGKTTISKLLQDKLQEPFLNYSPDIFILMLPDRYLQENDLLLGEALSVIDGFNHTIPLMIESGNNLIIDHVLQEKEILLGLLEILKSFDTVFIGIKSDLETVKKREMGRKNRAVGQAEYQFSKVHDKCVYDLEINTSALNPEKAVNKIIKFLKSNKKTFGIKKTLKNFED